MFKIAKFQGPENGANYVFTDSLRAFKLLLTLFAGSLLGPLYKPSLSNCQTWFEKYLEAEPKGNHFFFADSGRSALFLLLKSLNLSADSQVIIQAFSCGVVPNAVLKADLVPIICDIQASDYSLNLSMAQDLLTPKTKVLILQHTFGIPADIENAMSFCRQHDLLLIEDCAHSLGSEYLQSRLSKTKQKTLGGAQSQSMSLEPTLLPLSRGPGGISKPTMTCSEDKTSNFTGTLGHASIFSFGRDKIISSTIGGLGYLNPNPNFTPTWLTLTTWQENLHKNLELLPKYPRNKLYKALIYTIFIPLIRFSYHFLVGKFLMQILTKLSLINPVYTKEEKVGKDLGNLNAYKYPEIMFEILGPQLEGFEKAKKHKSQIAQIYATELGQSYCPQANYIRFPIILENQNQYLKIAEDLRKEGIFIGSWYQKPFIPDQYYLNQDKGVQDLPNLKILLQKTVLNLPTNNYVSESGARKIAGIVKGAIYSHIT